MNCSCGGNIEKVSFNSDWDLNTELWDCMCDKCGHKIIGFDIKCPCCNNGVLEFISINDCIEAGEGKVTCNYCCNNCLKDFVKSVDVEFLF